jgi:hypothetical protein
MVDLQCKYNYIILYFAIQGIQISHNTIESFTTYFFLALFLRHTHNIAIYFLPLSRTRNILLRDEFYTYPPLPSSFPEDAVGRGLRNR